MKVDVYTLCKNEIKLAPFFIDYWRALSDDVEVFVYDGFSTDGSRELFSKYDWIHVIDFEPDALDDYAHVYLKDECWKQSRGKADLVMVCDFDETVFSYDKEMLRKNLQYMVDNGYTITAPLSFNLIPDEFPQYQEGKYLHELSVYGFNDATWESKPILFNPNEIEEINFCMGAHFCIPKGNVKWFNSDSLFLIHAKFVGLDYHLERISKRIVSKRCMDNGFCGEKEKTTEELIEEFNSKKDGRFTWNEATKETYRVYDIKNDWSQWGFEKVYLDSCININKLPKYSVLTYIFNGYEQLREIEEKDSEAEYICITDDSALTSSTWNVVYVNFDENISPIEKLYRVRYNLFDYCNTDICVRIDGSIKIFKSLKNVVNDFNDGGYDCCLMVHPYRNSFVDEYSMWIKYRNYKLEQAEKCIKFIGGNAYSFEDKMLIQQCVAIERKNKKNTDIDRLTYSILEMLGNEREPERIDQIILSFVIGKYFQDLKIMPIEEDIFTSGLMVWYGHNTEQEVPLFKEAQIEPYLFNKKVETKKY